MISMEMKKYIDPEMEVTMFATEDVITTSGGSVSDGYVNSENEIVTPEDIFGNL